MNWGKKCGRERCRYTYDTLTTYIPTLLSNSRKKKKKKKKKVKRRSSKYSIEDFENLPECFEYEKPPKYINSKMREVF